MADYPVLDGNGNTLVAAANTSGYDDSRDPLNKDALAGIVSESVVPRVVIAAGDIQMLANDGIVEIAKTVPENTNISPPVTPTAGRRYTFKDGSSNADTYPVTFVGTLDGVVNPTFNAPGFACTFYWNGSAYRTIS